jgi:hypothetical protein
MTKLLDAVDHPLMFILFVTLAVNGMNALATHLFKQMGWTGPAAFFQHP